MATSIKIKDTTKRELEKLQAKLILDYGKKYSHQELIDLLVKLGNNNLELIISSPKTISKATFNEIKSLIGSWKIETDPDIIDEEIYGN